MGNAAGEIQAAGGIRDRAFARGEHLDAAGIAWNGRPGIAIHERLAARLVLDVLLDRVASVELIGPLEWVRSNKHTGVRRMPARLERR